MRNPLKGILLKRLDWYIVRKFLGTYFFSILLIVAISVVFDFNEHIDKLKEATAHEVIFQYYLNFIPYFINMFSPLFVFITVIFFTSRLAANSEIIAILSSGISYRRMLVPYIAAATLIALFSLGLNLYVIPSANEKRVEFEEQYIKHKSNNKLKNIHYQIAPGQFVFVESFSTWNNTAYKMTLESMEENRLVSKLSAESAAWDSTSGSWHMRKYMIRDYNEGLQDKVRCGEQLDTVIALTVTDFYRNENTIEALTIDQLNELIETQKMRGDANVMYAQIEKQRRMTLPFSAIILTIMGVALTSRKKRGGTGWNIALGIGLAFMYILFLRFSEMFVYTGVMSAAAALWLPNVVYTLIAAILYKIAPK